MNVLRTQTQAFQGTTHLVYRQTPSFQSQNLVRPLTGEDAQRIKLLFHLEKRTRVFVLANCSHERYVPILTPVRQPSILEHPNLFQLLKDVLVKPRGQGVLASEIRDVEVQGIFLFPQVSAGGCDVPHEDAVVKVQAAQCLRLQRHQLLDVLDEAFDFGQANAESSLVEEEALNPMIPWACRDCCILQAIKASPRRLDTILRSYNWVPPKCNTIVGKPVSPGPQCRSSQFGGAAFAISILFGLLLLLCMQHAACIMRIIKF